MDRSEEKELPSIQSSLLVACDSSNDSGKLCWHHLIYNRLALTLKKLSPEAKKNLLQIIGLCLAYITLLIAGGGFSVSSCREEEKSGQYCTCLLSVRCFCSHPSERERNWGLLTICFPLSLSAKESISVGSPKSG